MKESYGEGVATHTGLESCAGARALGIACAFGPEAGARCGSPARRDLCGGRRVIDVPTATMQENCSHD
jgi:hypothetical protein